MRAHSHLSILMAVFALGALASDLRERPQDNTAVAFEDNIADTSAGGLFCYRITTPAATYYLEKSGGGLSSLIDLEGGDWLGFHPEKGSGAAGEYRGFPNAVHQQAGNYFHPRNSATDPCETLVERVEADRVTISVVSSNELWAGRYDFFATHCTFTMTRKPKGKKYWILYEGTPGGQFDLDDWWMTSDSAEPQPMTSKHDGDIREPEWMVFGDRKLNRVLFLLNHEDDTHPDHFYQMESQMTVFGFGRSGLEKFFETVPRQFSIGFIESTNRSDIKAVVEQLRRKPE